MIKKQKKDHKYEGIYICGYCKKKTKLDDQTLVHIITRGLPENAICKCRVRSYHSSIKFIDNLRDIYTDMRRIRE